MLSPPQIRTASIGRVLSQAGEVMISATVKIAFGVILSVALLIAVLFALGADLMARDTRPVLRRRVRRARARAPMRTLKEAHT